MPIKKVRMGTVSAQMSGSTLILVRGSLVSRIAKGIERYYSTVEGARRAHPRD